MVEKIKEYLLSNDEETIRLGYHLLHSAKMPFEKKNGIMQKCGFGTGRHWSGEDKRAWWRTERTKGINHRPSTIWVAPFNWEEEP